MIELDNLKLQNRSEGLIVSGVYFLFKNDKLLYIGRAKNIKLRIKSHKAKIDFNRYSFHPIPSYLYYKESIRIEKELINRYKPVLNCQLNPDYIYYNQSLELK